MNGRKASERKEERTKEYRKRSEKRMNRPAEGTHTYDNVIGQTKPIMSVDLQCKQRKQAPNRLRRCFEKDKNFSAGPPVSTEQLQQQNAEQLQSVYVTFQKGLVCYDYYSVSFLRDNSCVIVWTHGSRTKRQKSPVLCLAVPGGSLWPGLRTAQRRSGQRLEDYGLGFSH